MRVYIISREKGVLGKFGISLGRSDEGRTYGMTLTFPTVNVSFSQDMPARSVSSWYWHFPRRGPKGGRISKWLLSL